MRKKKLISLCLAAVMALSLTACGGDDTEDATEGTTEGTSAAEEDATEGTTEAEGEEEVTYDYGGVTVYGFGGKFNDLNPDSLADNPEAQDAKAAVEEKYNITLEYATMDGYDGTNDDDILISSIASGSPATHIMTMNPESMITCLMNDVLFDITDHLDLIKAGSVYTDAASWQGRVYGVAYENIGDTWVLVYDRSYLEEIGMEKTPTQMFMEGSWDYDSFRSYLADMKTRLSDGVYPIGQYPYHWAVMAASANGVQLVDANGQLNLTNEAVIEAMQFYQDLENEGLAYPMSIERDAEGNTVSSDIVYAVDSEQIVIKRAESWQLSGLGFEFGIAFWPWGSNVTCEGDYTTLSDNYSTAVSYWGFVSVVDAAVEATGIPGEVLHLIAQDFTMARDPRLSYVLDAYEQEQAGTYTAVGAEYGQPRSYYTQEDITLADWGFSRATIDYSWPMSSAELVDIWTAAADILAGYQDARSTLQSYENEAIANLEEIGITQ